MGERAGDEGGQVERRWRRMLAAGIVVIIALVIGAAGYVLFGALSSHLAN